MRTCERDNQRSHNMTDRSERARKGKPRCPVQSMGQYHMGLLSIAVAVVLMCLAAPNRVDAVEISYDTGILAVSYSAGWGKYYAVRFTNAGTTDVKVTAVKIPGHWVMVGYLDVHIWSNADGQPGEILASRMGEYLSSTTWNSYSFSEFSVTVPAGSDIFAGLHPRTCDVPYDTESSGGANRSWWMQSSSWVLGGPQGTLANLMVRLDVVEIEPTIAPVSPTECPVVSTQCPRTVTQCPQTPQPTVCPVASTSCPEISTQCPIVGTACPAAATTCPQVGTECPESATLCPQVNTKCPQVQTGCPIVPTSCPPSDTICPSSPTACPTQATQCPTIATQCPAVSTLCPASSTTCPIVDTQCPVNPVATVCPTVQTQCPVVATQCPPPTTHTLTVLSTPITGIAITGDKPGTTNYTATCTDGQEVSLTAPVSVTISGIDYTFVRWTQDGIDMPADQASVQIAMETGHAAVAAYQLRIPVGLQWSTFLGGGAIDSIVGIAIDPQGDVLVAGSTVSADFPTLPGDKHGGEAFVAKISTIRGLLWATLLGGSNGASPYDLAADSVGNAYVIGYTHSTDFPVKSGFQMTHKGDRDGFIVKLDNNGQILWSSFLGGSGRDMPSGVAVDPAGNVLIAGLTLSADFPTPGGLQTSYAGCEDGFLAMVSSSGELLWARYLGGSGDDMCRRAAFDAAGNAVVTGYTMSSDFPVTPGAFDTSHRGREDAFVAKFSPAGQLVWSTFLGGTEREWGEGITLDSHGNVLVTGQTASSDFPVQDGFSMTYNGGGSDAFAAKLSPSGALLWATFLGGSGDESSYDIVLDDCENAVVTGFTASADFPTPCGFDTTYNGGTGDVFVAWISPSSQLLLGSFLGGFGLDGAYAVALDGHGDAFIGGYTSSPDFPIVKGFDPTYNGGELDAFVAKIGVPLLTVQSTPITGVPITGDKPGSTNYSALCEFGSSITLSAPEAAIIDSVTWTFVRWVKDGVNQPDGQASVQVAMDADHALVAQYEQRLILSVQSTCITGVPITGDKPGTTNYTAACDDLEVVTLTAPAFLTVSTIEYVFVCWVVDGQDQPRRETTERVTMDGPHSATATYAMPFDTNEDGAINILDLIFIRNKLGQRCP